MSSIGKISCLVIAFPNSSKLFMICKLKRACSRKYDNANYNTKLFLSYADETLDKIVNLKKVII